MKLTEEKLNELRSRLKDLEDANADDSLKNDTEVLDAVDDFYCLQFMHNQMFLDLFFSTSKENYNPDQKMFFKFLKNCLMEGYFENIVDKIVEYHRKNVLLLKSTMHVVQSYVSFDEG